MFICGGGELKYAHVNACIHRGQSCYIGYYYNIYLACKVLNIRYYYYKLPDADTKNPTQVLWKSRTPSLPNLRDLPTLAIYF